jgi:hypothetical protein
VRGRRELLKRLDKEEKQRSASRRAALAAGTVSRAAIDAGVTDGDDYDAPGEQWRP